MQNKVAIIGCGHWGKNLIRNFHGLGCLHAVSDATHQTASDIAAQYNVANYTLAEILQDANVKAVVIATPAKTHFEIAKQALAAGKHVFVEKPLTTDIDSANKLVELANSKKLTLMTGHLLQYHPAYLKLKQAVDAGLLGKLRYIYTNRADRNRIPQEESCLWDLAPHDFSMILGLVNEDPTEIYAESAIPQKPGIIDTTTIFLRFPSGLQARTFVSWLHPFKEQKMVVVGDKAMAVFDDTQDWKTKLMHYEHHIDEDNTIKATTGSIVLQPAEPLKEECRHFIDCIETGAVCRTGGEEALRVMHLLERGQNSLLREESIAAV